MWGWHGVGSVKKDKRRKDKMFFFINFGLFQIPGWIYHHRPQYHNQTDILFYIDQIFKDQRKSNHSIIFPSIIQVKKVWTCQQHKCNVISKYKHVDYFWLFLNHNFREIKCQVSYPQSIETVFSTMFQTSFDMSNSTYFYIIFSQIKVILRITNNSLPVSATNLTILALPNQERKVIF